MTVRDTLIAYRDPKMSKILPTAGEKIRMTTPSMIATFISVRIQPNSFSNGAMNKPKAYWVNPIEPEIERKETVVIIQPW